MTTPDPIAAVAAKLTEAQRKALMGFTGDG